MVAKEKANMERSRAEFEAELHLLSVEKDAATTEAELRVLQEEDGSQLDALSEAVPERHNDLTDSHPFLETRRVLNFSPGQENELTNVNIQQLLETRHIQTNASTDGGLPQAHSSPLQEPPSLRTLELLQSSGHEPITSPDQWMFNFLSFSRFLMKKELLMSRLKNYNDRPESFAAWKATFQSIMQELQVSKEEEIDLLINYLDPESSRQTNSIKTANFGDPREGLSRIWERLNNRYGSPEMVEFALKQKIANIPKLTNKDNSKL